MSFTVEYQRFRADCPLLKHVDMRNEEFVWEYHQLGPTSSRSAVIFLHGLVGNAGSFFHQVKAIADKGYRVLSVQWPGYYRVNEWVKGFDRFLDIVKVTKVHLVGTDLGGFVAQAFAAAIPSRVSSLILSNSFKDTRFFVEDNPVVGPHMLALMPHFVLKKMALDLMPTAFAEMQTKQACDFMASSLDELNGWDLAARLSLLYTEWEIESLTIPGTSVMIIDVSDPIVLPGNVRSKLREQYGDARLAMLKGGGDYPALSRADEFTVHILVHLRSVGDWGGCQPATAQTASEQLPPDMVRVLEEERYEQEQRREARKAWVNPFQDADNDPSQMMF